LRKVLPWTFATFLAGSLALAGFPLFSGFFSKDEIIHHALMVHPVLGVVGLVTALLTAFYTFRMVFLAFFGRQRIPEGVHPHESGPWMLVPLVVLSIGAIGAGYIGIGAGGGVFHRFLTPVFAHTFAAHSPAFEGVHSVPVIEHVDFWAHYGLMIISGAIALVGIFAAYVLYVKEDWLPGLIRSVSPRAYKILWNKYYVDELYGAGLVEPARQVGRVCVGLDDYLIDGLLWLITAIPRALGYLARTYQSGMLQGYALTMVVGIAIIMLLVFGA
jgi:NADH-quinone oxidoreductase subunit L